MGVAAVSGRPTSARRPGQRRCGGPAGARGRDTSAARFSVSSARRRCWSRWSRSSAAASSKIAWSSPYSPHPVHRVAGLVEGLLVLRRLALVAVTGFGDRVEQAARRMAAAIEQRVVGERHLQVRHHELAVELARVADQVVGIEQRLEQDADQVDRILLVAAEAGVGRVEADLAHAAEQGMADHLGERAPVLAGQDLLERLGIVALQQRGEVEQFGGPEDVRTLRIGLAPSSARRSAASARGTACCARSWSRTSR